MEKQLFIDNACFPDFPAHKANTAEACQHHITTDLEAHSEFQSVPLPQQKQHHTESSSHKWIPPSEKKQIIGKVMIFPPKCIHFFPMANVFHLCKDFSLRKQIQLLPEENIPREV